MKNITKKIASIAMAFTLLCAGTAITNTVSPKSDNTIVIANAAHNCSDHVRYTSSATWTGSVRRKNGVWQKQYRVVERAYCVTCGSLVKTIPFYEWRRA